MPGFWIGDSGVGFWVSVFEFLVSGFGFWVSSSEFRVKGLEFSRKTSSRTVLLLLSRLFAVAGVWNPAQTRQSRPDSGLSFQVKALKTL